MDEQLSLAELGLLLLLLGGPIYAAATAVLVIAARRTWSNVMRASHLVRWVILAWSLVLPLTIMVWWVLGLLPDTWMDALAPSSDRLFMGFVVAIPALIASVIVFGAVFLSMRRSASRPAV